MKMTQLTNNPTRTLTIEQQWLADINRRFRALDAAIVMQLKQSEMIVNAFAMSIDQQRIFMAWLEVKIDELFLTTKWQEQYQLKSYMRALKRVRGDLIGAGVDLALTNAEREIIKVSDFDFSARPSLVTQTLPTQPIHQDALEFLFSRSYDSLKTATGKMSATIRTELFDGVQAGEGALQIARRIAMRTGVAKNNARLIARTETIQAYHRSTINETERLGDETGEEFKMVWITARDERVRKLHAKWHGTIITPAKCRERISLSPFNCRCGQRVITESMLTESKKSQWKKQRLAVILLAS